jgi:hypothetical protein
MGQVITAIWRGEGGDLYERDYAIPRLDVQDSIAYALSDINHLRGQVLCLMVNASAEQRHLIGLSYQPALISPRNSVRVGMGLINAIAGLVDQDEDDDQFDDADEDDTDEIAEDAHLDMMYETQHDLDHLGGYNGF